MIPSLTLRQIQKPTAIKSLSVVLSLIHSSIFISSSKYPYLSFPYHNFFPMATKKSADLWCYKRDFYSQQAKSYKRKADMVSENQFFNSCYHTKIQLFSKLYIDGFYFSYFQKTEKQLNNLLMFKKL